MSTNPYLTVGELALLLRRSEKWIYQHIHTIQGAFKLGRCWFIDREILTSSLKSLAQKPKAPAKGSPNRHNL